MTRRNHQPDPRYVDLPCYAKDAKYALTMQCTLRMYANRLEVTVPHLPDGTVPAITKVWADLPPGTVASWLLSPEWRWVHGEWTSTIYSPERVPSTSPAPAPRPEAIRMYDDRLGAPDSKSEKLRSMYERLWAEYERTAQGYHKATVADDPGKWTFDEWYIKDVQAARIAPYSTGCDCPTCTDARKRHVAGQRAYSYSQFVQDLRLGKDLGSA